MLLAFDCSTDTCSLALSQGGMVLGEHTYHAPRLHARVLAESTRQLLANLDVAPSALSAVAVAAGPGSYTGLRIAVSAAKGLCMATGAKLLTVGSLQAHAAMAAPYLAATGAGAVWVAHPSRRGEAFAALIGPEGQPLAEPQAVIIADGELPWAWPARVLGIGAALESILHLAPAGVQVLALPHILPSAVGVLHLAEARLQAGQWEDVLAYEPAYLKPVHISPPKAA